MLNGAAKMWSMQSQSKLGPCISCYKALFLHVAGSSRLSEVSPNKRASRGGLLWFL